MLKRIRPAWQAAALLTFNLVVIFLAANLVASIALLVVSDPDVSPLDGRQVSELRQSYPDRSDSEIQTILAETWNRDYVYEPFTQFKEGAVSGEFVNVDGRGFRVPPEGARWPPPAKALTVFFFGGSTAFGYGIADNETIPVRLEAQLRSAGCEGALVYNLARSNYFSSQERILFEQLLVEGQVPSAAIFMDGLNEFMHAGGEPKFTRRLRYFMAETRLQLAMRALKQMPLARLAGALVGESTGTGVSPGDSELDQEARSVLDRWNGNRNLIRAVSEAHGVLPLFVWQPVPILAQGHGAIHNADLLRQGYELHADAPAEPDLLWLADLPEEQTGAEYVDRVHYSAQFSSELAAAISQRLAPEFCSGPATASTPS